MFSSITSRIPIDRWPKALSVRRLAKCGREGHLVEAQYPGRRFPWGAYEQLGHAGMAVVIANTAQGKKVALMKQWRPTDKESIELPAGSIGSDESQFLEQIKKEILEEVGDVRIVSVKSCNGFAHDVARALNTNGGPKNFYPFIIEVEDVARSTAQTGRGDQWLGADFYPVEEVRQLVRDGRIADMPTCFFLLAAGIIETEDFGWVDLEA